MLIARGNFVQMKLNTRCYLYFGSVGLAMILELLIINYYVQVTGTFNTGLMIILGLLGLVFVFLSNFFVKKTINRIIEMNDYLKNQDCSLRIDNSYDELSELRQSLIEMQRHSEEARLEIEANYRRLQLSNMNLEEKYAQSYTLQLIQEEISRELDTGQLLVKAADIIIGVFGCKRCTIYMVDEEHSCLLARANSGFAVKNKLQSISLEATSIIARSCVNRKVYTESDADSEEKALFYQENVRSVLTLPLMGRSDCLGTMVIEHEQVNGISKELIDFARLIAQELSLSAENAYLYEKMRHMAIHDALTGVYNRMYLMDYMAQVFGKRPTTVSVLLMDLDHFKQINDKYGHLTGDLVLKTFTVIVKKLLPEGILARYGGEEFVIVLPEYSQDKAFELAEVIRQEIGSYPFKTVDGLTITVTMSAGLANYPLVSDHYEGLLQLADEALYAAKKSGRNRVWICIAPTKGELLAKGVVG